MPTSAPETAAITARYQAFAAEARGRSPQYEDLAVAVGRDQPGAARCCRSWRFFPGRWR